MTGKITDKVHNYIDPVQLKKDSGYSSADLTSAMMDQSAMFAHYGVLAAKCAAQLEHFKTLLDLQESRLDRQIRDRKALAGEKTTEPQIKAEIALDPKIIALKLAVNEARQINDVAKFAVETFRHRRDMLIQHGLISREEMKGELAISVKNAREAEMEMARDKVLERRRNRMTGIEEE